MGGIFLNALPRLQTARLDLAPPVAQDFAPLMELLRHPETARFLGAADKPGHFLRFCRGAGSWLLYGYGTFTIRLRGQDGVIGNCGVFHSIRGLGADFDDRPEAGWILGPGHTGKDIAAEAMAAIFDWFDRTHALPAYCMVEQGNEPSLRLAAKLGFRVAGNRALPDGAEVMLLERGGAGSTSAGASSSYSEHD